MTTFSSSNLPVLILGGGISGLSAAWRLAERGTPVHVFESAPETGGLAGTVRGGGYSLDYGPHSFFTEDAEIFQTVRNLFPASALLQIPRDVKFYFRGRAIQYPFTPADILFQMGFLNSLRVFISFLKTHKTPPAPASENELSVEDWAVSSFGDYLYQSFFKPYTEQFWKIPCKELSARSIPSHTRLSFTKTLKHLFGSTKKTSSILDREKLPTFYPSTGYGEIADKIALKVLEAGGQIHKNARVIEVRTEGETVSLSYVQAGETKTLTGSQVISTLPLSVFLSMISPAVPETILESVRKLEYRPLLFLGMAVKRTHVLPSSYMYVLDRPYNRLTEMNRFSSKTSPKGENLIGAEIPCRAGDSLWNASKETLLEHCLPALKKDHGLDRADIHHLMLLKARYAYPVYRKNYFQHLQPVLSWIQEQPRLHTLGRSGEFRYMDADQCMRRAFDLAERLLQPQELYAAN